MEFIICRIKITFLIVTHTEITYLGLQMIGLQWQIAVDNCKDIQKDWLILIILMLL